MNKNKSDILEFFLHLHPLRIPESSARFTYTLGLGGLALFSFLVTAVTGIFLVFAYSPTPESANRSMQYIATVMRYGWYIRNLHYWAAQAMVISAVLHMVRIVLSGGYLGGRGFNWIIGIILLVLIFLMDYTGYSLRWDVESNYALITGINLIQKIPVIGKLLCRLVTGGFDITENTLLHVYGWHIIGLPIISSVFMSYHFYRIRKDGGISFNDAEPREKTISRKILLKKEIIFLLIAASAIIILSVIYTPGLSLPGETNHSADNIKAPWIFLGVQFLLRCCRPFVAGIIIPALILLYWASQPYLDKNQRAQGIWFAAERLKFWLPFPLSILVIAILSIAEMVLEE